jgi:hypothetical protein
MAQNAVLPFPGVLEKLNKSSDLEIHVTVD